MDIGQFVNIGQCMDEAQQENIEQWNVKMTK